MVNLYNAIFNKTANKLFTIFKNFYQIWTLLATLNNFEIITNEICTLLIQRLSLQKNSNLQTMDYITKWKTKTKHSPIIASTIRPSVSLFESLLWSQAQLCSLLTSLVCFKYWPCKAFYCQSCNLFCFFTFFKAVASCKLSSSPPLAACISLSSFP